MEYLKDRFPYVPERIDGLGELAYNLWSAIYHLLEKEIVPLYYKQDEDGVPREWVRVMKEAVKSTGPRFSAGRMVKEYALKYYQHALVAEVIENRI